MNTAVSTPQTLSVNQMSTLRAEHDFVLVVADSGLIEVPHTTHIARLCGKHLFDHTGTLLDDVAQGVALAWMPLPFCKADVMTAYERDQRPLIKASNEKLLAEITAITTRSQYVSLPRVSMLLLQNLIGDNRTGDRLPDDAPGSLILIRIAVTDWLEGNTTDEQAVALVSQFVKMA